MLIDIFVVFLCLHGPFEDPKQLVKAKKYHKRNDSLV